MVKNSSANAGDIRDPGSIPGSERLPGEGNGNPLQYWFNSSEILIDSNSCLENSMDGGAWWDTAHSVAKTQTQWKQICTHAHTYTYTCIFMIYV